MQINTEPLLNTLFLGNRNYFSISNDILNTPKKLVVIVSTITQSVETEYLYSEGMIVDISQILRSLWDKNTIPNPYASGEILTYTNITIIFRLYDHDFIYEPDEVIRQYKLFYGGEYYRTQDTFLSPVMPLLTSNFRKQLNNGCIVLNIYNNFRDNVKLTMYLHFDEGLSSDYTTEEITINSNWNLGKQQHIFFNWEQIQDYNEGGSGFKTCKIRFLGDSETSEFITIYNDDFSLPAVASLVYLNNRGGYDTLNITGKTRLKTTTTRNTATQYNSPDLDVVKEFVINTQTDTTKEVTSGLHYPRKMQQFRELFASPCVWEYRKLENGEQSFEEVILETKDFQEYNNDNKVVEFPIKYRYAYDTQFSTIPL